MTQMRTQTHTNEFVRRATAGAAWISIEMIAVQGTSLLVFGVTARFVTPAQFGLISICLVTLHIAKSLMIDNFAYAVVRKSKAEALEYTTAFWMTAASSLFAFLLLQVGASFLESAFEIAGLAHALRETSAIIVLMGLSRTHESWMFRHSRFRSLAIRSSVGTIIGGIAGVILAVRGFGLEALVAQQLIAFVISSIGLWIACPWRPSFSASPSSANDILRFVFQATPGGFMNVLNQTCDTILIAYFFGPTNTGFYSVGKRLRLALQLAVATPINGVATPSLADAQQDPARLRKILYYTIGTVSSLCAPLFLGVSAVAHDAIEILFGAKWLPAAPVLEWLAAGGLVAVLIGYNDTVFAIRGRPIWTFYVSSLYTALAIVAFVILSRVGSSHMAAPFVLPYLITFPISIWLCSRVTTLTTRDWSFRCLPSVFAAIVMVLTVRLVTEHLGFMSPVPRLSISCVVGAIVYLPILAIIDGKGLWKLAALVQGQLKSTLSRSAKAQTTRR